MASSPQLERPLFHHARLQFLRSIRIIRLHPSANFDDMLTVTLKEVSLDDASQAYEALSYVWGSRRGSQPLMCNDAIVLVTPSCESALRHLRLPTHDRVLWVDALCIDQAESPEALAERNVQVPLMGEVYSKASRTLCWLGRALSFTGQVMGHLEKIGDCPSKRGLDKLMAVERQLHEKKIIDPETSCLDHIFCHPWHSRSWTTQEVAFSKDCQVLLGHHSISWEKYSAAANFLIYEQFIGTLDLQASKSAVSIDMRNVLRDYLSREHATDLEGISTDEENRHRDIVYLNSCLSDVNQLQATDPKDKIYGVHSVYTRLGIPLPAVDYTKSMIQVYTEATLAMVSWSRSLKVLRAVCSVTRDPALPSWVPDWNDGEVRLYMPDGDTDDLALIHSTDSTILSPVAGRLLTRGWIIGRVVSENVGSRIMRFPTRSSDCTLPILSPGAVYRGLSDLEFFRLVIDKVRFFRNLLGVLYHCQHLCDRDDPCDVLFDLATLGKSCTNDDSFETFAEILIYPETKYDLSFGLALTDDWKATDITDPAHWTDELTRFAVIAAALITGSVKLHGEDMAGNTGLLDLFQELAGNLADQAVVTFQVAAEEGPRLGTTFRSVAGGDRLCLLQGAEWPVILRPEGSNWRFIGPAYVRGLEDQELWTEEDSPLDDFMLV